MVAVYREYRPPAALRAVVACLWEQQAPETHRQRVVPDGCVDLIWASSGELAIAGPDTGPRVAELAAGTWCSGLRIRAGAAGSFLGVPASELRDMQVAAGALWTGRTAVVEEALAAADPTTRLWLLAEMVAAREVAPDPVVRVAARALGRPGARVADVATQVGVSERQLHRRVLTAVGYGPKMLARVARLRRLIALSDQPLAARAFAAGYSSQSHMSDEVRRLTGTTAVRFLEDAALTAA